jgi:hypothetical protein
VLLCFVLTSTTVLPSPTINPSGPRTALQRTFIPENFLKHDLIPLCAKERIPLTRDGTLPVISDDIKKFFLALHLSEGTAIHNSHCYIAEHQAIDSKRKLSTASQRQVAWLAKKCRTEIAKAVEPFAELSAVSLKSAGKRKQATVSLFNILRRQGFPFADY